MFTFEMNEAQAHRVFSTVKDRTAALKNWIVSNVESGNFEKAQELATELRQYQKLYAAFNIESKKATSEQLGKPIAKSIVV